MLRLILFVLLVNFYSVLLGQNNYTLSKAFTTSDGLPSNHIYQVVEDNKGFLWVATDAGIARFDGKYFQVFTVQNGLPDDEVLEIAKEKNGRIWVNCFKQSPAYFDEIQNRFINAKEDTLLANVKGVSIMHIYALPDGGVLYENEIGSYIFKDGKIREYPRTKKNNARLFIKTFGNENLQFGDCINKIHKGYQFVLGNNDRIIDSISAFPAKSGGLSYGFNENKFYILSHGEGKCFIYSNFNVHPIRFSIDSVSIPEPIFWYGFTPNYLNILSTSGKIYVFNKSSLQQQMIISGNYSPTYLYNDKQQNIWVSTVDKGLLLYKQQQIDHVALPENYTNTNFLSVAKKQDGTILAGNFYGEVVETNGRSFYVKQVTQVTQNLVSPMWQRKIIISQNKIFTFSEGGNYVNYNKLLINSSNNEQTNAKTAIVYNDSIIIFGNLGYLLVLNTVTEKIYSLKYPKKRVTAIAKAANGNVYFGSTDGLYKCDLTNNTRFAFLPKNALLEERVTGLCYTKDNLLWIATASNGLVAVRSDTVVQHITMSNGIISNSCKSIIATRVGQVWLGTNQGISIINYQSINGSIKYTVQNLSANDGLSNNIINEMLFQNDTVYAATGNGISIIPVNIPTYKFNIAVQLIGVRINQKDTIINNNYQLKYNQQNIQLQFAGIELGGNFKNLLYSINNNNEWITLNENLLSLQLDNGKHIVQLRAVDGNGNVSDKILTLEFTIATPFWKAIWFWLLNTVFAFAIIFYFVQKRNKQKQQQQIAVIENQQHIAEIEMQAIKAQINPHFVFNCLNSIKSLNYQQRYAEADNYTDKFSQLLRSTLEFSSEAIITLKEELDYIINYVQLEQLRFGDKLQFDVKINESINTNTIQVPSLILQPYVENAIRHGIGNLIKEIGRLTISISQQKNYLEIIIDDNGVGVEQANLINKAKPDYHQSKGMELNKRRAELHNISFDIFDKKDIEKGTRITLKIPLI